MWHTFWILHTLKYVFKGIYANQSRIFIGRINAEAETPILWPLMQRTDSLKRLWCWKMLLKAGEGDDRGWDGWMASRTRWTWVWASSGNWRWTGRPGVVQSMGLQRVEHDWVTELKWWQFYDPGKVFHTYHLDYSSQKLKDKSAPWIYLGEATNLLKTTSEPWRRKWQPTPVFLPGESHGEEPGRLQSVGPQRVGQNWATSLSLPFTHQ